MKKGRTQTRVTEVEYEEVKRLHSEGMGRNAIAKRLDRPEATITVIARRLGLTFDRTDSEVATAARKADLAEMRTATAIKLQETADKLIEQVFQPHTVFAFGGVEFKYESEVMSEPPPADKRALLLAAGAAIDRSLKLSPPKGAAGLDEAKSMLGRLAEGLATYAALPDPPTEQDD